MSKKVLIVKITTPHAATELAGLPLEATVLMADVAATMREGLPRVLDRGGSGGDASDA